MLYKRAFSTNINEFDRGESLTMKRRILALHAGFPLVPDKEERGMNNHQKVRENQEIEVRLLLSGTGRGCCVWSCWV